MKKLSVTNASRLAGVTRQTIYEQIENGKLQRHADGIDIQELALLYPKLDSLVDANELSAKMANAAVPELQQNKAEQPDLTIQKTEQQAGTVELLVRELEWNKELLEQTNAQMARQLAEQRALIADQARRLDEKDRFWARQIEIAQSLLPAPAPVAPRKKFLGIF